MVDHGALHAAGSVPPSVPVTVWNDYVCPWAYLGRHRTRVIESLGCVVSVRPFELHPETPATPLPVRPGGRLDAGFQHIATECAALGIAFRAPTTTPDTRAALQLAELIRLAHPHRFADVDAALFEARFVHGQDLADPEVLRDVLTSRDLPASLADAAVAGDGEAAVTDSIRSARDHGIGATPTWRFESGFVIPGVHPVEQVERWTRRIVERSQAVGRITADG